MKKVEKKKGAFSKHVVNNNSDSNNNDSTPSYVIDKNGKKRIEAKKVNKDGPVEMPSNIPVSRFRQIIPNKTKKFRDPRFDNLSGSFDERLFRKQYSFLDDIMKRDISNLTKQLELSQDPNEKQRLFKMIQSQKSKLRAQLIKDKERELKDKWVEKEVDSIKKGKTPYHLTKKGFREIQLEEKYKSLKESGKLDKFIEKKRKKVASKERVFIPRKRQNVSNSDSF
eukprot:gene6704-8301_t